MANKTFAIITDIHSNIESLEKALSIIADRSDIDQMICLGDCFSLGPEPEKTLEKLRELSGTKTIRPGEYVRVHVHPKRKLVFPIR